MGRNFEQILRSVETDSWNRTKEVYMGTVNGGTISATVSPVNGDDIQYITDISVQSNLVGKLSLFNGTAFLFQMKIQADTPYNQNFKTPLRTSAGTLCLLEFSAFLGTANVNLSGYTKK